MSVLQYTALYTEGEAGHLFGRDGSSKAATSPQLLAFLTLQVIGLSGCSIAFISGFFAESSLRHPPWFSFVFSWIFSALSYLLLFIAGKLRNAPFSLCLVQSAFVYAAPPLTTATTLAFLTQIFFNIRNLFSTTEKGHRLLYTMLVGPYVLHATIAIETIIMGLQDDDDVRQSVPGGYCYLKSSVPSATSLVTVFVMVVPTTILAAWTSVLLFKNWTSPKFEKYSPSTSIRVIIFAMLNVCANVISAIYSSDKGRYRGPNITLSLLPIAVVLIFGAKKDMVSVWKFRKPASTRSSSNIYGNAA